MSQAMSQSLSQAMSQSMSRPTNGLVRKILFVSAKRASIAVTRNQAKTRVFSYGLEISCGL